MMDAACSLMVCEWYGVKREDVLSRRRFKTLVEARMVCSLLLSDRGYTMRQISEVLDRDYTCIIHHLKSIRDRMKSDPDLVVQVKYLRECNTLCHSVSTVASRPRSIEEGIGRVRRYTTSSPGVLEVQKTSIIK